MTRPLSEFTYIDEYQARKRQKTLDTLRQTTEKKLALERSFSPFETQRAWYGEALYGPFSPPPLQPVARASTPTLEEEQGSFRYTQMLSTMEIPTFEDTLKPLTSGYSTWRTCIAIKGDIQIGVRHMGAKPDWQCQDHLSSALAFVLNDGILATGQMTSQEKIANKLGTLEWFHFVDIHVYYGLDKHTYIDNIPSDIFALEMYCFWRCTC